ncbi:MAG: PAS domain S-box protein, partial [Deltaproteobacteria bacterium]|nr:PAS domain S-box protein [Deltaproteobacteria bacterium]
MTNNPSYKTLEQSIKELQREAAELRRSDEAIWEGEEKYRTLFDESRDAIYITSREGEFLDVNRAMLELFEYTKEEMIDTLNIEEIYVYPGDRNTFQAEIEAKGSVRDYEVKFCKKNGTEMDCLLTGSVRHSSTGRILGYQGIIRDVTEQKRVERLRDDVQRMMRHDLKSPLIGIIGLAGLLLKSKTLANKQDSAARMIQELGERMLEFIDRTRDLFQMEQGSYTLKPQEVNICSVLRRIKKTLKPLVLKRNTDFAFTIYGQPTRLKGEYMILCEETLVEIMFVNLIKNAIEASPEGGAIHISINPVERLGQDFHCIDIHNSGVVPVEICENFFKPYTTSGKDGGTG